MSDNHSPKVPSSPAATANLPDDGLDSSRKTLQDDSHSLSRGTTSTYITAPSDPPLQEPPSPEETKESPTSSRKRAKHYTKPKRPTRKRMRPYKRDHDEGSDRARLSPSPSVSSSEDDEPGEDDPNVSPEEPSSSAAVPPKKKRTRTLTTPHQSEVLHALLEQSRFPTTAMREEVGKQIGLSARKVQVWFQNQRQKARRPKAEAPTPLARPPQFGAYPSTTSPHGHDIAGSGTSPPSAAFAEMRSSRERHSFGNGFRPSSVDISSGPEMRHHSHSRTSFSHEYNPISTPSVYGSHLAGPGVPGPSVGFDPYSTRPFQTSYSSMRHPHSPSGVVMARPGSTSSPEGYMRYDVGRRAEDSGYGHSSAFPTLRSEYPPSSSSQRSPIVLPPLQFEDRAGRDAPGRDYALGQRPSTSTLSFRSPTSPTAHDRERFSLSPHSLSPPFQQQPHHWPAHSRAESSSRPGASSRPSSSSYMDSAEGGPSYQRDRRNQSAYDTGRQAIPTSRTARFDPVREPPPDPRTESRESFSHPGRNPEDRDRSARR